MAKSNPGPASSRRSGLSRLAAAGDAWFAPTVVQRGCLAALMLTAACSGETGPTPTGATGGEGDVGPGIVFDTAIGADTNGFDTAVAQPDAVTGEDAPADDETSGGGDGASAGAKPCTEPGGWGCPCAGNADCNSHWCIDTQFGKTCTVACLETCPSADWTCVQAAASTGDLTYVCAPRFATLCEPCATDAQCEHLMAPAGKARCLKFGVDGTVAGSFCSQACATDADCPADYGCKSASGGTYCIAKSGECSCSKKAISENDTTACALSNTAGTCTGTRTCSAAGLSECSAKVPAAEACNFKDEDCDGQTDEGFVYDDVGSPKLLGKLCGVGACIGGEVECSSEGDGVICTSASKAKAEICDYVDNDCDGKTDEDLGVAQSPCKQVGVCTVKTVGALCEIGSWKCSYDNVPGYEADKELTCDGQDNNCDGEVDESFGYKPAGGGAAIAIGQPCDGVGACGKGVVECAAAGPDKGKAALCSTDAGGTASGAVIEACNDIDDDCDGQTDEGCDDDLDGYCDGAMVVAAQASVCKLGSGDCNDALADVHPKATESCNDVDDNCDSVTDNGCDDDLDGYCDDKFVTVGKPAGCAKGGGDCNDTNGSVSPSAQEDCNAIDDDCDGHIDAGDEKLKKAAPLCENQKGVCQGSTKPIALCQAGQWGGCDNGTYALASASFAVGPDEATCDDLDNDCDGKVDGGCDDDGDGFCEAGKANKGIPAACPKGGGDCDDKNPAYSPAAQETCDAGKVDENCNGAINEENAAQCTTYYPDSDKDSYGDQFGAARCLCEPEAKTFYTSKINNDCNDKKPAVNPGAKEHCGTSDDDDCNGNVNDVGAIDCVPYWFDGDGDGYGGKANDSICLCGPKVGEKITATKGLDCIDINPNIHPGKIENCVTAEDDNCNGTTNDLNALGCSAFYVDADKDGYGLKGSQAACLCIADAGLSLTAKSATDCNDGSNAVNPGVADLCSTAGVDDNCDGATDGDDTSGCKPYYLDLDDDGFGSDTKRCLCKADAIGKYTAIQAGDCQNNHPDIKPSAIELCDGVDNNCKGGVDDGAVANCKQVNAATEACSGGKCVIASCDAGDFDIDGSYGNGCECPADGTWNKVGTACTDAIDLGDVPDNKTVRTHTGRISPGETGKWIRFLAVDGPDNAGCDTFHIAITFVNTADHQFDVYRGSCSSGDNLCSGETHHQWRTDFFSQSGATGPGALGSKALGAHIPSPSDFSGECKCTGTTSGNPVGQALPGMNLCKNNSAQYYVLVRRKPGTAPKCDEFTLKVQNGVL